MKSSKAISQALSIVIVIAIILVGSAGYFGYFAGVTNRQTTTLTATSTFTTTPSPNVTITEEVISENIETISTRPNGCVSVLLEITNSTSYILPNGSASQFYATVTHVYTNFTTTITQSSASATTTRNTTITITCA